MLLEGVRNLLGWHSTPPVPPAPAPAAPASLVPEIALSEDDDPVWPSARLSICEALWGEGFIFPGGRPETMHLAKPLGLSAAASLLLLGAGSGGPAQAIAAEIGVWVSGFEANAHLVAIAGERSTRAGLGRRAQVELWDPRSPKFPLHYYHHGMAFEPLRGAKPEPALAAVSMALKPGGQLVLTELVADLPLKATDPVVAGWARLERRPIDLPSELVITRVLGRLGFDVRIVEDISKRQMQQAIEGWRTAIRALEHAKPNLRQTSLLVHEAELWLLRLRLMRAGKLRLVRWHAIGRGGIPLPG